MKILVESGVVESRQEGKWTHYKISEKGSAYAGDLLKELTIPNTVADENVCCKKLKPSSRWLLKSKMHQNYLM
ncbi:hypothetical protein SDC9_202610 [bioreactor metagenome]|uniref:Uncharacterized protein n=1 Tax=bioreactor metagenome TaxID=1076179 RepID=A0A645IU43_9ZZZZ